MEHKGYDLGRVRTDLRMCLGLLFPRISGIQNRVQECRVQESTEVNRVPRGPKGEKHLVEMIDAAAPKPGKRGPHKKGIAR